MPGSSWSHPVRSRRSIARIERGPPHRAGPRRWGRCASAAPETFPEPVSRTASPLSRPASAPVERRSVRPRDTTHSTTTRSDRPRSGLLEHLTRPGLRSIHAPLGTDRTATQDPPPVLGPLDRVRERPAAPSRRRSTVRHDPTGRGLESPRSRPPNPSEPGCLRGPRLKGGPCCDDLPSWRAESPSHLGVPPPRTADPREAQPHPRSGSACSPTHGQPPQPAQSNAG